MDLAWCGFLAGVATAFGVLEYRGMRRGGTLSATLRYWVGVEPDHWRRHPLRAVLLGVLGWFAVHILR